MAKATGTAAKSGGKAKALNLLNIGSSTFTVTGNTKVGNNTEINGGTLVNNGTMTIDPGSKGNVYTTEVNTGQRLQKFRRLDPQE